MSDEETKYLSLSEFQDGGFLLEANRQFFHPLGLALGIASYEDDPEYKELIAQGKVSAKGLVIYDWRDDPEGVAFASLADEGDDEKHDNVMQLWNEKSKVRQEKFGWVIQPMGSVVDAD